MPEELDLELDELVKKYGINQIVSAAQRIRTRPARPVEPAKAPAPKYVGGIKQPTAGGPRRYGTERLAPRRPPVVARPSAGRIQTYMGAESFEKKLDKLLNEV